MRRVLVTGGAGFVGRPAVAALIARGFEIHAVGRRAPAGAHVFHAADLLDEVSRRAAVRAAGASHLLHLAWVTEPGRYWQAPDNLDWTAASLDLVRGFHEAGGTRAVVAGTCAEYDWTVASPPPCGEEPEVGVVQEAPPRLILNHPHPEPLPARGRGRAIDGHLSESAPCRPTTLYGAAKDGLRRILSAYAAGTGLSLAWGRLFYLYGPGEASGRLVGDAVRALLAGQEFATSEGRQRRDFLHVSEAGEAFAALLDSTVEGPVNVGSGAAVPVRAILETLGRLTGRPELIAFGARPLPPSEPACIEADIRRLTEEVGFRSRLTLDEGLRATLAAYAAR
ncbi:NAD(P)-dependent oxidoreductase [Methylorubrum sp. SB2]|uniref:NAD-dependent epimerase/dehydratase family protein n=1 Tax=Methylorubrum subtropicum TaxID=3138812 RepID=UPI00313EE360